MLDAALTDPQQVAAWTTRALNPKNSQGKFAVWAFKKKLRCQLLQKVLPSFNVPLGESEKIVSTFADVAAFRNKCGYRKVEMWKRAQGFKCNVWQGLSANGEAFVQVAEELLFTDKYDCEIREFVKGTRGTPQELLKKKAFKDLLTPVVQEPATKNDNDGEAPAYEGESGDELPPTKREGTGSS